jgi:AraC family transcriptional regulator
LDRFKVKRGRSELTGRFMRRYTQTLDGVLIARVIDRGEAHIGWHAHDWPVLSLFIMGSYSNETELGARVIAGPSALLYRPRAVHQNTMGALGHEQIEIAFDADWLGRAFLPAAPVSRWIGGRAGAEARALARLCAQEPDENELGTALRRFLLTRQNEPEAQPMPWVQAVTRRLASDLAVGAEVLGQHVNRHPSWLGTAYRRATGEGLLEVAARFRVERAAYLLRETATPLANVAIDAGFCDQSHMNRTFRRVLGRTPLAVRNDRRVLRLFA